MIQFNTMVFLVAAVAYPLPFLVEGTSHESGNTSTICLVWRAGDWSTIEVFANDSMLVHSGGELIAASVGDIALHADGRWFSRAAGTLKRVGAGMAVSGTHPKLGPWVGWQTAWQCTAATMVTTVKSFTNADDVFVFEQRFPSGAKNTSLMPSGAGKHSKDWKVPISQALSQWPSFTGRSMAWKAQGWSGTMSCGTAIAVRNSHCPPSHQPTHPPTHLRAILFALSPPIFSSCPAARLASPWQLFPTHVC
jgi:hypothetical protein